MKKSYLNLFKKTKQNGFVALYSVLIISGIIISFIVLVFDRDFLIGKMLADKIKREVFLSRVFSCTDEALLRTLQGDSFENIVGMNLFCGGRIEDAGGTNYLIISILSNYNQIHYFKIEFELDLESMSIKSIVEI